jgi:hypothetical protein
MSPRAAKVMKQARELSEEEQRDLECVEAGEG